MGWLKLVQHYGLAKQHSKLVKLAKRYRLANILG
jgi:hypothetical protein